MINRPKGLLAVIAALAILSAAICSMAQERPNKQNQRTVVPKAPEETQIDKEAQILYSYEFTKSDFFLNHVLISHDALGRGSVSFTRKGEEEPIVEPLELSGAALQRISGYWTSLRFLDSDTDYQSDREYPHLGTMRLRMSRGTRNRIAEFNWTNNSDIKALVEEYRRVSNQSVLVFDISVARQNQPLDSPKLLDRFERFLSSNQLSDPKQLLPLLRELNTDERLPLMARNHAARLLEKIGK